MTQIRWDNKKLEPVIITYNRAEHLKNTLAAFYDAGFAEVRVHVLDNASTDATSEVVTAYADKWPLLTYHRNVFNIGGNANILRAVEISDSEYCWVIGDDDEWHLDDVSELQAVLEKGEADIVRLGWLVSENSRGSIFPMRALVDTENMFFASLSMISATITRRNLLVKYIRNSYMNIGHFYPQLVPYILSFYEENPKVYSPKINLMRHTPSQEAGYFNNDLEWYSHWLCSARFFKNDNYRVKFIDEILIYGAKKTSFLNTFFNLLKRSLNAKALGHDQVSYLLIMLMTGKGHRFIFLLLFCVYLMIPYKIVKITRDFFKKTTHKNPTYRRDISRL